MCRRLSGQVGSRGFGRCAEYPLPASLRSRMPRMHAIFRSPLSGRQNQDSLDPFILVSYGRRLIDQRLVYPTLEAALTSNLEKVVPLL